MADNLTSEQRKKNMKAIRSQSELENVVSRELWKRGWRFRKNNKTLFGKPDIAIKKYKVVIFIDSCFWHCCPDHGNFPKSNQEFWEQKLQRNVQRDQEVNDYYNSISWNIKRVWEHEVKQDLDQVIDELSGFIESCKSH
ncbi:very short patch repair endonuclease [Salibacterium qingdaonense]|uniref:Very short patch repair endonuclease n=1 Tax=Salibacterium qingdaonense TaxID=266892 RepID=A0A1I4LJN3_9BACI|nr:very short patch repair endonuclease [Salibacterium qingdaonense]SFL91205.1 T/G mismatch-specific endonuclease [Salibacterium qingdaonense]